MDLTPLFLALDQILNQIRDKLHAIEFNGDGDSSFNEPLELARAKHSRECNTFILKYQDVLEIIDVRIKGHEITEEERALRDIYGDELSHFKLALRQAQLKSYGLEENRTHQQRVAKYGKVTERTRTTDEMRNELFGTQSKTEEAELAEKTIQDKILEHNKSITASLQSTRQMMTTSILQTELNIESVEQQTKDLSTLDNLLVDLQTTLKKSRNIVKFIEKQDRADKNKIYMSIGFLLLCSAWVIWRRILKLPVKILLWSLFKIFRIFLWFLPKNSLLEQESLVSQIEETAATIIETAGGLLEDISQTIVSSVTTEIIRDEL